MDLRELLVMREFVDSIIRKHTYTRKHRNALTHKYAITT